MSLLCDLWMPSSQCNIIGPMWPSIEAENFELKPGLIALVQHNQFGGSPREDPHEHIRTVMDYSSTVKYHGVSQDAITCRLFTFSLRDGARDWYHSLPSRIFSWGEMSEAFLEKYFPLHKQSVIRDEIFNFAQHEGESLYDAWERYKALFRRCPNHGLERWLELQIFYMGLTCDSRSFLDMAAGGVIANKTLEDAFLLIENMAFHQLQWYSEKPNSELMPWCQQITTPHQLTLTRKPETDSPCNKIELAWIIFDDDDVILSDTHMAAQMDTIVQDSVLLFDDSSMDEPNLQIVSFDAEELRFIDNDHMLLEPDMEKFTFDDVSCIGAACLEPEMEIFMIDYDEVVSDVKELNSTISLVDISHREISTTTDSLVSSIQVVLKILPNHLRYDLGLLDKTCHIIDIACTPCDLLMISLHDTLYCYAYIIGYSIDDLEGVDPITYSSCPLSESNFRLPHVLDRLRAYRVRFDIPWDPGGFTSW